MADTSHSAAAQGLADATGVEGGHAGEATGLPQLDFSHFPNQIFWLIVALAAIYFILSRVALPRIATVLAERQGSITNDIAAAEELKQKAQDAEAAYEKALADARAEAQRIAGETRDEIKADLDEAIARADAEIAARSAESEKRIGEIRASAEESVEAVAKDVAVAVVAALGGKADAAAVEGAVDARLKG
ncbi:F0F1 ATP synthase subunit B' [Qingshengfaniella alkalisoli]|uniref:ATP synthase subunit b n=1 Tax=Qingshengfaniella alkalisoli TaxID=2599296 RepID=A0A5B8J5H6_9RHOB|nr:F0F1 ATP synthase subunit B' [Qingshengfaniella alkalisoli]QDY69737.1 F0F1 ATP synthase subunit B' [Qingshengfaniella alkalisoli]